MLESIVSTSSLSPTACCLFLSTILVMCRRVSSWMPLSASRRPLSPSSDNKRIQQQISVLIDLPLPYGNIENIQRLVNDIVLTKVVDGTQYDKCFLRITSSGDASASLIYNYVSELYSKSWNEAVAKKSLGLNFLVLHELLAPDFLKQLEENKIGRIFTSHPTSDLCDLWKGVDVRDTKVFAQPLRQGLAANPLVTFLDGAANDPCTITKSMIFDYVAVGGSFDQLHNGHRKLLSLAAAVCAKELTIGITGDAMLVNKAHQSLIEPLSDRISHVRGFLSFMKPTLALNVVEINDPFGPAVTDPCLQAILVSSETIVGAFKINHIRREKGMNALHILVIGRADAAILSSSFLREQKSHSL